MQFRELALYFQKLEETPSRNEMTKILADLFTGAKAWEIDKICYLTQGRVAPLFVPLKFGVADKMMIKAIGKGFGVEKSEVTKLFGKMGDLGQVAESLSQSASWRTKGRRQSISITDVFAVLEKVAKSGGAGTVEQKVGLLSGLFKTIDSLSARYLVRIPLGKLRLGFSDMTVLDALSWMLGKGKEARPEIEKSYNVRPDLGFISKTVKERGLGDLAKVSPRPGTPILMARAERLSTGREIIEKIGKCAIEPKIDGFRLAVHKDGQKIWMFSRNMEDVTFMYPDLVEGVKKQIKVKEAIFEGEAIAYDPKTGQYLPFQETVQRKRKYDIQKMAEEVPLKLIVFDLLYINGENLIDKPFSQRRRRLEEIVKQGQDR